MLRMGRVAGNRSTVGGGGIRSLGRSLRTRDSVATSATEIWPDLGRSDLTDTIRRICTLCGWTRTSAGTGRTLAIASAHEREGKRALARAIAIAMAHDHSGDVLLLECDLLRTSLEEDFQADPGPGLTELLTGDADLESALRPTLLPNLRLLPAGTAIGPTPSRLLRSPAMSHLLDEVRERLAFIVLDLPAVLRSSDAAVLAQLTDGVVLVARTGSTEQRAVLQALDLLSGSTLHGVVLNRSRSRVPGFVRRMIEP